MKGLDIDKTKNLEDEWEMARRFFLDCMPKKCNNRPFIGYGCGIAKQFRSKNFIEFGIED